MNTQTCICIIIHWFHGKMLYSQRNFAMQLLILEQLQLKDLI